MARPSCRFRDAVGFRGCAIFHLWRLCGSETRGGTGGQGTVTDRGRRACTRQPGFPGVTAAPGSGTMALYRKHPNTATEVDSPEKTITWSETDTQAAEIEGGLALFREAAHPLAVFLVQDAVTGGAGRLRRVVVGVAADPSGRMALLRDEEVLDRLNKRKPGRVEGPASGRPVSSEAMLTWLERAREHATCTIGELRLPFRKIQMNDIALFWPEGDRRE